MLLIFGGASEGNRHPQYKIFRQTYNPILQPVVAGMPKERLETDLKPVFQLLRFDGNVNAARHRLFHRSFPGTDHDDCRQVLYYRRQPCGGSWHFNYREFAASSC